MLKVFVALISLSILSNAATLKTMKSQLSTQQSQAIKYFNTNEKLNSLLKNRHGKDLNKTMITLMAQSMSSIGEREDSVCEMTSKWQVSKSFVSQISGDLETITMNITTATVDESCGEVRANVKTFIDSSRTEDMKVVKIN